MKIKFKTVFSIFTVACLITVALSACTEAGNSPAPGQNNQLMRNTQRQGLNGDNMDNMGNWDNMGNGATQPGQGNGMTMPRLGGTAADNIAGKTSGMGQADMRKAENIKKQLTNISGIKNADVIVMGDTALVGIESDGNTRDTNTLRTSVKRKVQEIDKTITNVTVSESSDIMNRMRRLGTDITGNKPMKEITDEFNNMVNGRTP